MLNCVACRRMYARCVVVVLLALCLIAPEGIEAFLERQYRDLSQCVNGGNAQDGYDYAGAIWPCEKWCESGGYTGTCESSVKCVCRPPTKIVPYHDK